MSNHIETNTGHSAASVLTAAELIEAARLERRFRSFLPDLTPGGQKVSYEQIARQRIDAIPNPLYQALLLRRGIFCEKWGDLSEEMSYSPRALQRFYHAALAQLQYVLDENLMEK